MALVFFAALQTQAQKKSKIYTALDEENAIFKNEWSIGLRMHTNGLGAFYERVWIKNIYKKNVLQTNFFYFNDFKQKKVKSDYAQVYDAKGYFYGKQNNFWNFNVLFGQRKILAEKADYSGVRVAMVYMGGLSLGILKPYGLLITQPDLSSPQPEVLYYSEAQENIFLNQDPSYEVYGAAGLARGFNKIKPIPGIHTKFGFNFDWASHEYLVKSIEVGAQLDIYYKKLPVMISERNKPYILNFYISFQLGKRW